MSDEVMTAPEEQALFQLSNGRYIMDEAQSRVMFQIMVRTWFLTTSRQSSLSITP